MSQASPSPLDSDPPLDGVTSILACRTVDDALAAGGRVLAAEAGAAGAGLLVLNVTDVPGEAWEGVEPESRAVIKPLLEQFARDIAENRRPAADASASVGETCVRMFPIAAGDIVLGAGCLTWPDSTPPRGFEAAATGVARMTRILAEKVHDLVRTGQARVQLHQYERWFKRLDDQLRVLDRERQKFTAVVSQTDTYVAVTDENGSIKWTNKAMSTRFDPDDDETEWLGLPCRSICEGLDSRHCGEHLELCPVKKAMATNQAAHQEIRRSRNGSVRNLYLTALPIKGPDGRPHEAIVMIQDLSDLEVLRKSEARYRILFERSSSAIVMIDPEDRRIVMANAMARRMLDYSMSELLQLSLEDLHPEPEWKRLENHYRDISIERGLLGQECRLKTRQGEEKIAEVFGSRFEDEGRRLTMIEFRDLTERRRAELALVRAEERLKRVIDNAPIVLFAIDRDGTFTLSEGRGLERLALTPGAVVGQSVHEAYKDHPRVLESIDRALAGEEFTEIIPIGDLAFETWFTPLRNAAGEPDGFIGVANDVTDAKQLEEQLRHAQKMEAVGRLAGGVAHDFNNLLTVIIGHAELMMNRAERGSPDYREARSINQAGIRGSLLAGQLLAFSRKDVVESRVHDMNAVLSGVDEMIRRLIGEDITLTVSVGSDPALVLADKGQLEQVIMNLAVNARDAMPVGGNLTFEVSRAEVDEAYARKRLDLMPGSYVVLAVTDNGVGMDAATCERLFEPFFTTKARGKGTGLGLSIIYGIARQAGGDIHVYSEPGHGSTFRVYLPRVPDTVLENDCRETAAKSAAGSETVLLTEDEEQVRSLAKDILEMNGYTVLEADSGEAAIEVARAHAGHIDLLLTDVVMPGMGGGKLANALTEMRPGIRVLYMSGYPDDAIVRHGILDANAAFIQKPFSLDGLSRKIREVLNNAPHESWPAD